MSRVEQIEAEIEKLSREEVRNLARWLAEYDARLWDAQIDEDTQAGRLDALYGEADAERKDGTLREWPGAAE